MMKARTATSVGCCCGWQGKRQPRECACYDEYAMYCNCTWGSCPKCKHWDNWRDEVSDKRIKQIVLVTRSFNSAKFCSIANCVNSAPFRGHPAGTVMAVPNAERKINGRQYWKWKIRLVYRDDGFDLKHAGQTFPVYERTDFSKFTAEEFEAASPAATPKAQPASLPPTGHD